jgi:hypothetical protein
MTHPDPMARLHSFVHRVKGKGSPGNINKYRGVSQLYHSRPLIPFRSAGPLTPRLPGSQHCGVLFSCLARTARQPPPPPNRGGHNPLCIILSPPHSHSRSGCPNFGGQKIKFTFLPIRKANSHFVANIAWVYLPICFSSSMNANAAQEGGNNIRRKVTATLIGQTLNDPDSPR